MQQLQTLTPSKLRFRPERRESAPRTNGQVIDLAAARQAAQARVEKEAAYRAALELIQHIDHNLTHGLRHYRTKAGRLLLHLDEVIEAILRDDLLLEPRPDPAWEKVQDLVA
ncbi:MAG: hypothetical protein ACE5H9_09735 [Anaerolineae bacterium]